MTRSTVFRITILSGGEVYETYASKVAAFPMTIVPPGGRTSRK